MADPEGGNPDPQRMIWFGISRDTLPWMAGWMGPLLRRWSIPYLVGFGTGGGLGEGVRYYNVEPPAMVEPASED